MRKFLLIAALASGATTVALLPVAAKPGAPQPAPSVVERAVKMFVEGLATRPSEDFVVPQSTPTTPGDSRRAPRRGHDGVLIMGGCDVFPM